MSKNQIILSRECIRDTFPAKRQACGKLCGLVEEVRSTDPYLDVTIVDYDVTDEDRLDDVRCAEEVGNQDDMHDVN